jgi:small subunit ribosomal protein S18
MSTEDKPTGARPEERTERAPAPRSRDDYPDRREDDRSGGRGRYRAYFKKKVCRFCTQKITADYKDVEMLRKFVTERGKILPRRITGNCAKHQRVVSLNIKRARVLALLPFVAH